tara:strand:- start:543 stop:710 length:168 start_codon:yes stop_codon:yes gene_type:complete
MKIEIVNSQDMWVVSWKTKLGVSQQSFDTFTQAKKFRKELKRPSLPLDDWFKKEG